MFYNAEVARTFEVSNVLRDKENINPERNLPLETRKPTRLASRRATPSNIFLKPISVSSRESQRAGLVQRARRCLLIVIVLVNLGAVTSERSTEAFVIAPSPPRWTGTAATSSSSSAASAAAAVAAAAPRATATNEATSRPRTTQQHAYFPWAAAAVRIPSGAGHAGTLDETHVECRSSGGSTAASVSPGESVEVPPFCQDAVGTTVSSAPVRAPHTTGRNEDSLPSTATPGFGRTKATVGRLPGTWLSAGFPKWVHVVRRRMRTKEDWLGVHASSSLVYQVGGALWLLNVMGLEHLGGVPQLEIDTPVPLFLLGAGLVSSLSSIPMANTRSWVLNGVCASVMQLWFAWYVSGAYPACLTPADPWLAAAGFTILAISYVEAEEAITKDSKARELTRQTPELRNKKASGKVLMRKGDYAEGDAVNRYGALANLVLNAPHLFATLLGSGWVERLAETYPSAPALLFHAYFALATSTSISLLAPTLYTRRLIDAKTFAAMQFISLAPLVTSAVDSTVMGAAATNNPLELYFGFLH